MSNPLPETEDFVLSEAIYRKIVNDLSFFDERAKDICVRAWDANLKSILDSALNKLQVCVLVGSPSMSSIDDVSGGAMSMKMEVVIESNALLKSPSSVGWSAYDVAGLLRRLLEGYTEADTGCSTPHDELRITGYKLARNGLNETAQITISTIITLNNDETNRK